MEPEGSLLHLPESDQSRTCLISHSTFWKSILTLSSIYAWVFQLVSFPQNSYNSPVHTSFFFLLILDIRLSHIILLDLITRKIFVEESRLSSSSLCRFLHSPVFSFLLGPNILLNNLFSHNVRLPFSLNVSDHVSYPYKTTGEIIVLYILILIFVDNKLEEKKFCTG